MLCFHHNANGAKGHSDNSISGKLRRGDYLLTGKGTMGSQLANTLLEELKRHEGLFSQRDSSDKKAELSSAFADVMRIKVKLGQEIASSGEMPENAREALERYVEAQRQLFRAGVFENQIDGYNALLDKVTDVFKSIPREAPGPLKLAELSSDDRIKELRSELEGFLPKIPSDYLFFGYTQTPPHFVSRPVSTLDLLTECIATVSPEYFLFGRRKDNFAESIARASPSLITQETFNGQVKHLNEAFTPSFYDYPPSPNTDFFVFMSRTPRHYGELFAHVEIVSAFDIFGFSGKAVDHLFENNAITPETVKGAAKFGKSDFISLVLYREPNSVFTAWREFGVEFNRVLDLGPVPPEHLAFMEKNASRYKLKNMSISMAIGGMTVPQELAKRLDYEATTGFLSKHHSTTQYCAANAILESRWAEDEVKRLLGGVLFRTSPGGHKYTQSIFSLTEPELKEKAMLLFDQTAVQKDSLDLMGARAGFRINEIGDNLFELLKIPRDVLEKRILDCIELEKGGRFLAHTVYLILLKASIEQFEILKEQIKTSPVDTTTFMFKLDMLLTELTHLTNRDNIDREKMIADLCKKFGLDQKTMTLSDISAKLREKKRLALFRDIGVNKASPEQLDEYVELVKAMNILREYIRIRDGKTEEIVGLKPFW
ncbi:MAG: hypothetical protein V1909_04820 [Candidatus Micrarchaeota archaeon]